MAKVEIEIDDGVLDMLKKKGYQPKLFGLPKSGDLFADIQRVVPACFDFCSDVCLIVEPIPDDSIPFPDWVPEQWEWVAIDEDGEAYLFELEPAIVGEPRHRCWCNENGTFDLVDHGFPTSWVPAMPDGDWTKAKWRRRNVSQPKQ